MSAIIKELLNNDNPMFIAGIIQLEKTTGSSGVDTRLLADILSKAHKVMRSIGLDPKDTTGSELYHSLITKSNQSDLEDLLIDTDYVLIKFDSRVVSLNLIDVIENRHHELLYENQISSHGRRALIGELVDRYSDHNNINNETSASILKSMGLLSDENA